MLEKLCSRGSWLKCEGFRDRCASDREVARRPELALESRPFSFRNRARTSEAVHVFERRAGAFLCLCRQTVERLNIGNQNEEQGILGKKLEGYPGVLESALIISEIDVSSGRKLMGLGQEPRPRIGGHKRLGKLRPPPGLAFPVKRQKGLTLFGVRDLVDDPRRLSILNCEHCVKLLRHLLGTSRQ